MRCSKAETWEAHMRGSMRGSRRSATAGGNIGEMGAAECGCWWTVFRGGVNAVAVLGAWHLEIRESHENMDGKCCV